MASNRNSGPTLRSVFAATVQRTAYRTVKPRSVLLFVAALATLVAVSGTLASRGEHAAAKTSGRQTKSTLTAQPAKAVESVATRSRSAPVHESVDLFGDSLGYQVEPYLDMFLAQSANDAVSDNTFGGTATCDWMSKMAAAAAERPQVAILVFSGNAFTPCMDGVALWSPRYYDRYTTDTEQAIGIFSAVGAHVFLVGTPIDQSSVAGWNRLDDIYRQLAEADPLAVTYVDAAAAVETPSGAFTWQLPCMSIEPSCGPNGSNIVRSPDGIHFCPDGTPATRGVTGPCDEYSPGAFRFALAIASAVTVYANPVVASVIRAAR